MSEPIRVIQWFATFESLASHLGKLCAQIRSSGLVLELDGERGLGHGE